MKKRTMEADAEYENFCENERPIRVVICQKRKGHSGRHRAVIFWEGVEEK